MIEVPDSTPLTTPEPPTTVATVVVPLVHVPPVVPSVKVMVAPAQTGADAAMAAGSPLTVTTVVVKQPVLKV